MKPLLLIVLIFSECICYAQSAGLAIINNPDGYINVRKGRTTDSAVIGRLFNDQVFLCEFDDENDTDWADVVYMQEVKGLTAKQKKLYADFIHPKDSVDDNDNWTVSRKDSSCWMEGFIYSKEFTWISDLPNMVASVIKDTAYEKDIFAQNDSIILHVSQTLFDSTKHKITNRISKNDVYLGERIDGKEVYGTDGIEGNAPIWEISALTLTVNGRPVEIPPNAYNDLFEAHIEECSVSFDKRGNTYIYMPGSDGAEAYDVVWIIKNGKYLNRYIDTSFD